MKDSFPMVSIVCPVYNKERYLNKTIRSVLAQTTRLWELILVDDGSTDSSLTILKDAEHTDNRIRCIRREDIALNRKGANVCRNIGLSEARGKFVVFLDADDVLLPFCLEQRLSVAENNPGSGAYIFNVAYTMKLDEKPYAKMFPSKSERVRIANAKDLRKYFLKKFLSFELPWHTSGPLWDKRVLQSMHGFDEDFQRLQDPEIHTRFLLNDRNLISYHMDKMPYDVLHLKDDRRVVWSTSDFYEKQIVSIEAYLKKFVNQVRESTDYAYLKYLIGYLIFAETLTYRYLRDNNLSPIMKKSLLERRNRFYRQEAVMALMTWWYKLGIKAYEIMSMSSILCKWRIPGVILLLMRRGI